MPRRRAAFAASALLVVVDLVVVVLVVVGVCILVFDLVFILLVVEIILVVGQLEFDGRVAGHDQERAALRARQLVADVDIVFINIDGRIALGTNRGHARRSLAACVASGFSRIQ